MRKAWSTIFLLCMACMICMSGLCLAKDGNWIKYHNHDSSKYYVNPSSLKAREYEGRKYLEANVDISGTQMLLALDIENGKYIVLEGHNHVTGKTTKTDISQMSQQSPTFSGIPIYDKLIHWVEKNRPDVINEIRTHNRTAPPLPAAPKGKTDVSGPRSNTPIDPAPGVDRQPGTEDQPGGNVDVTDMEPPVPSTHGGTLANISGDIPYEVLDSGAVKFTLRRGLSKGTMESFVNEEDILRDNTYYLFAKPEEFNAWPGAYVVGTMGQSWAADDSDTMYINRFFDYNPATNSLQFYTEVPYIVGVFHDKEPQNAAYAERVRVIDKNTIYRESSDLWECLVSDGPFRIGKWTYFDEKSGLCQDTIKYLSCEVPEYRDVNSCAWQYSDAIDGRRLFVVGYDALPYEVAVICCILNGNLGEVPEGHDLKYGDYHFSRE